MMRALDLIIGGTIAALALIVSPIAWVSQFFYERQTPPRRCAFCQSEIDDTTGMCEQCTLEESMA